MRWVHCGDLKSSSSLEKNSDWSSIDDLQSDMDIASPPLQTLRWVSWSLNKVYDEAEGHVMLAMTRDRESLWYILKISRGWSIHTTFFKHTAQSAGKLQLWHTSSRVFGDYAEIASCQQTPSVHVPSIAEFLHLSLKLLIRHIRPALWRMPRLLALERLSK